MSILALVISVIALILAILAYQKAGGTADLKKRVEALTALTDSLREKMADALSKVEKVIRKEEEKKGE